MEFGPSTNKRKVKFDNKATQTNFYLTMSDKCRICREGAEQAPLLHVCACIGSMKWVHRSCVNLWRLQCQTRGMNFMCCEVCKTRYTIPGAVASPVVCITGSPPAPAPYDMDDDLEYDMRREIRGFTLWFVLMTVAYILPIVLFEVCFGDAGQTTNLGEL